MLTFGDLQARPDRLSELGGDDVLVAALGPEVVVHDKAKKGDSTMIFQHETIAMMRADRANELKKLKEQLSAKATIVPIRKKPSSFWDQITVGRAPNSDIVLPDPATSNVHAHFELDVDDHPMSVQDLGSSNGTFVNRIQLHPHTLTPLRSGDCVRFGQTVFYYVTHKTLGELLGK